MVMAIPTSLRSASKLFTLPLGQGRSPSDGEGEPQYGKATFEASHKILTAPIMGNHEPVRLTHDLESRDSAFIAHRHG